MKIRKIGSPIAPIFGTYVKILDLLFFDWLDKFTTVLLALSPPPPTILLSSALNTFGANYDDLIIFNIEVNGIAIFAKALDEIFIKVDKANKYLNVSY